MVFNISTGIKTIDINRDGVVVGSFAINPKDLTLYSKVTEFYEECQKKISAIIKIDDINNTQIQPQVLRKKMEELKKVFEFFYAGVDKILGDGIALIMFNNCNSIDNIQVFFTQILSYLDMGDIQGKTNALPPETKKYLENYLKDNA